MAKKRKRKKSGEQQEEQQNGVVVHDYSLSMTNSFLSNLDNARKNYKPPEVPKRVTLADFLKQPNVYDKIKGLLEQSIPWTVIADAINQTFGTTLKPTTISAAYSYVAQNTYNESRAEIAKEIAKRKAEERRKQKAAEETSASSAPKTTSVSGSAVGSSSSLGSSPSNPSGPTAGSSSPSVSPTRTYTSLSSQSTSNSSLPKS